MEVSMNRRVAIALSFVGLHLMACWCGGVGSNRKALPGPEPAKGDVGQLPKMNGDVVIGIEIVEQPGRRVRLVGATNLPRNTVLGVIVQEDGPGFFEQSQCTVSADGKYLTELIGPKNGLANGNYGAEVFVSMGQPPEVQKIIGGKGENLTGPLVKNGRFGPRASANKEFVLGGAKTLQEQKERRKQRLIEYRRWTEQIVDLEKRLGAAKGFVNDKQKTSKWVTFARSYREENVSLQDAVFGFDPSERVVFFVPLQAIQQMFNASLALKEDEYRAASADFHAGIVVLKQFIAKSRAD